MSAATEFVVADCVEFSDECSGPVLRRWPGYDHACPPPRCSVHGTARVAREEAALARHGNPDSPCPPRGFDPLDAGERWDEDDPW